MEKCTPKHVCVENRPCSNSHKHAHTQVRHPPGSNPVLGCAGSTSSGATAQAAGVRRSAAKNRRAPPSHRTGLEPSPQHKTGAGSRGTAPRTCPGIPWEAASVKRRGPTAPYMQRLWKGTCDTLARRARDSQRGLTNDGDVAWRRGGCGCWRAVFGAAEVCAKPSAVLVALAVELYAARPAMTAVQEYWCCSESWRAGRAHAHVYRREQQKFSEKATDWRWQHRFRRGGGTEPESISVHANARRTVVFSWGPWIGKARGTIIMGLFNSCWKSIGIWRTPRSHHGACPDTRMPETACGHPPPPNHSRLFTRTRAVPAQAGNCPARRCAHI